MAFVPVTGTSNNSASGLAAHRPLLRVVGWVFLYIWLRGESAKECSKIAGKFVFKQL
jgi:hypothetical protein